MTPEPEDIDDLLARLDEKRQALEDAVTRVEEEHAAGRTGLSAYGAARVIEGDYRKLLAIAQARIAEALADLTKW